MHALLTHNKFSPVSLYMWYQTPPLQLKSSPTTKPMLSSSNGKPSMARSVPNPTSYLATIAETSNLIQHSPTSFLGTMMTSATSGRPSSTSIGQAVSHNNSLSNDFKTPADQYLIPFIVVALIAVVVFTYGVFITRQAHRGKIAIKDLELTIALKEATNQQPASTNNVSNGEKTERSGKATANENHVDQSNGASKSSDADLADGNYAAVQPKAPFWASMSYVDSSQLSTYQQPTGDGVPLEVIVSTASETNSEDMVDENKKQTVFGSFDDGEAELSPATAATVIYSQPFRKSRGIAPPQETRRKSVDSKSPESSDEETPAVPPKNY